MLLVRVWGAGSVRFAVCARRHGHEGRPDHAVAEAIAAPDLLDDLALGPVRARDVRDGFVLARIERSAGRRIDTRHAFALEQQAELAIDGSDALEPGIL